MTAIDPRAAEKLQPELIPGESIYWAGMPNPSVLFHASDWGMIPFSLLWGGFAIFWETGVLGFWNTSKSSPHPVSDFMALWGIPFVLVGQYMIWGRFILDAWLKRRTFYAITNRRVLLLQEGWKRKTNFVYLDSIAEVSREGDAVGSVWLGPKYPLFAGRGARSRGFSLLSVGDGVPVLADIDNVDSVHRLILELREKSRSSAAIS
jgi:hypothetical protein